MLFPTIVRHTKYKKMVVCPFAGEIPTKVFDSSSFISLVISPFLKNNDKDGKMPLQLVWLFFSCHIFMQWKLIYCIINVFLCHKFIKIGHGNPAKKEKADWQATQNWYDLFCLRCSIIYSKCWLSFTDVLHLSLHSGNRWPTPEHTGGMYLLLLNL